MKRRIVSLILALVLVFGLAVTASAYTDKQMRAADALNRLDLFRGRSTAGKDFALDSTLSRAEGAVLLLRVIGEEAAAKEISLKKNPFSDVTEKGLSWAVYEITYAYNEGLVKGTSSTTFAPNDKMSDCMFLTLLLRHLGYKDGNNAKDTKADFIWNNPYALAKRVGLITSITPDSDFTRGDAVLASWNAMEAKFKGTSETLAENLIEAGVFDESEYEEAREIWAYGDTQDDNSGSDDSGNNSNQPSIPVVPDAGDDDSDGGDDSDSTGDGDDAGTDEKRPEDYTWEEFVAMDDLEKEEFIQSFESEEAFAEWLESIQENSEGSETELPWEAPGAKQPEDYTLEEYAALDDVQRVAFAETFESEETFETWLIGKQEIPDLSDGSLPWEAPGAKQPEDYTWEEFAALDEEQMRAFEATFESEEAFLEWLISKQEMPDLDDLDLA